MYNFHQVQHRSILTYSLLIGLTPLIPIPFLDDVVKSEFQRRMIRQIAAGRGQQITPGQVETLLEEDFFRGCIGGCLYALLYYPLRELLSKLFFIVEWRRAFNLISSSYYTGFLLDCAFMDGYRLDSPAHPKDQAKRLRLAIDHALVGANFNLIKHLVRNNLNPVTIFRAVWQMVRANGPKIPGILGAIPRSIWQSIRSAPGSLWQGFRRIPRRIRQNFHTRVQVLLGRERAPEMVYLERVSEKMQAALLDMPTDPFDELRERLRTALGLSGAPAALLTSPREEKIRNENN